MRGIKVRCFAVSMLWGVSGFLALILCSPPVRGQGDTCADAESIDLGSHTGNTVGASSDGEGSCGASAESPDSWFRHTVAEDCFLIASTCPSTGNTYDTVISMYDGCPGVVSNELSCNDDTLGDCGLRSTVAVVATAGQTYWIRVSGYQGASGNFVLELSCGKIPEGDGPDISITDMGGIRQVGRLGSTVAVSMSSTLCNIGSAPLDWFGNPNPRHPFLVFNAYRLMNDRLEQIGQSWIKHGFSASQNDLCGVGCVPFGGSSNLGVGCADIYGVSTNASQGNMSPRSEVNPWNGAYVFEGSHLDVNGGGHDAIEHRLQIRDADLDRSANQGAVYIAELYALSHDDSDRANSMGFKRFNVSGAPGGTWNLNFVGGGATSGPLLDAWLNTTRTVLPPVPETDGRCYLAAKATDNGDGTWHYEYALYNLDMDRAVGSFSIPVADATEVTGVGFHAVRSHDEDYSNEPWTATRTMDGLVWSTTPFDVNPFSNPLRWGTLYNFRFDADAEPASTSVTLGIFNPGSPAEVSGPTTGPSLNVTPIVLKRGDADGNGTLEITDAIFGLNYLFLGQQTPSCLDAADANDSGKVDLTDSIYLLTWLFNDGRAPPPPGPMVCGRDPTPDVDSFPRCEYPPSSCE